MIILYIILNRCNFIILIYIKFFRGVNLKWIKILHKKNLMLKIFLTHHVTVGWKQIRIFFSDFSSNQFDLSFIFLVGKL